MMKGVLRILQRLDKREGDTSAVGMRCRHNAGTNLGQAQSTQLLLRIPDHWEIVRIVTHCLSLTFHHCNVCRV